jgi:hypothetical protein
MRSCGNRRTLPPGLPTCSEISPRDGEQAPSFSLHPETASIRCGMANSTCVGCGKPFTEVPRSREHILPGWLAQEVEQPNLSLKQYRHDEDKTENELLRSHDLGSFVIKNVCEGCNNGWMSRLEGRAKPILPDLMNMRTSLLQLSADERTTLSAWAIKTAFMIASAQQGITDLPWQLFQQLGEEPKRVPTECFVLATQLPFLPKGFLYACPSDTLPETGPFQVRIGFSIHQLHFVVVIPQFPADRKVRTSGVHIPIWPLDLEIIVRYQNFPTLKTASELINYLVGLVSAGILTRRP